MNNNIKVGVIRWDAWVGNLNSAGLEAEKALSNSKYHDRLPFYTEFIDNNIKIRCITKEIICKEIDYATKANIDYFAFCWYPFNSGLDTARNLFLEINQSKINWCIILGTNTFNEDDALWLINQFNTPNYQKINNRPIVYIFDSNKEMANIINFIRENSIKYSPYFIGLVWNKQQAQNSSKLLELDAVSQYCTPGQNNLEYKILSRLEKEKWKEYSEINTVVPWITTGWDKRPRYDSPVSWEDCSEFNKEYIQNPTLNQLEKHVEDAINFQLKHDKNGLILIYAWNEFDEGGFIEPTIFADNSINDQKLNAIGHVINKYKNSNRESE